MQITRPLREQAYEYLKEKITSGDLKPDVVYSETKIAKECGVSRTPLRDALQVLSQERYIDIIPSKGFIIHKLTERDLLDTYQIRCAIEGFCIVHLTTNRDTHEGKLLIKELEYLIKMQEEVINTSHTPEDFAKYDTRFHHQIVYFVNNQVITSIFENFFFLMKEQALISLRREGRLEETLVEHQAIIDGIKSGKISDAYSATLYHLEKPKEIINIQ